MEGLLDKAHNSIQQLLQVDRDIRAESRTWLTSSLASLDLDHCCAVKCRLFLPCAPDAPSLDPPCSPHLSAKACQQLLALWCEQQPSVVAQLASSSPQLLRSFFAASDDAIRLWFQHFNMAGIQQFKYGALALANFALTNRDAAWHLLVWGGKHPQAPVAVANKPHYFCELDLVATVRNLLRHCPEFWSSQELRRSLAEGQWLAIDTPLIVQALDQWWHNPAAPEGHQLQQLLAAYVGQESWRLLCQRLLPWLTDQQLLQQVAALSTCLAASAGSSQNQQQEQGDGRRGAPGSSSRSRKRHRSSSRGRSSSRDRHRTRSRSRSRARHRLGDSHSSSPHRSVSLLGTPGQAAAPNNSLASLAAWCRAGQQDKGQLGDMGPLLVAGGVQWDTPEQLLLAEALGGHRQQLLLALRQLLVQEGPEVQPQLLVVCELAQQLGKAALVQPQALHEAPQALGLPPSLASGANRVQLLLVFWLLRLSWLMVAAEGPEAVQGLLQQLGCTVSSQEAAHSLLGEPPTAEAAADDAPTAPAAGAGEIGSPAKEATAALGADERSCIGTARRPQLPQQQVEGADKRAAPGIDGTVTRKQTDRQRVPLSRTPAQPRHSDSHSSSDTGSSSSSSSASSASSGDSRKQERLSRKASKHSSSSKKRRRAGKHGSHSKASKRWRKGSKSHGKSRRSSSSSGGLLDPAAHPSFKGSKHNVRSADEAGGAAVDTAAAAAAAEEGELVLGQWTEAVLLTQLQHAARLLQLQPAGGVQWRVEVPPAWCVTGLGATGGGDRQVGVLQGTAGVVLDQLACWLCRCWVCRLVPPELEAAVSP